MLSVSNTYKLFGKDTCVFRYIKFRYIYITILLLIFGVHMLEMSRYSCANV